MKIKPLEAFWILLERITWGDRYRRQEKYKAPGKVVEGMSPEHREALSQLKSDDLAPDKVRVEEYWMKGPVYDKQVKILEFEKSLGIEPPPRKKYNG